MKLMLGINWIYYIMEVVFRYFHVMIAGPEDSPFAGGVFKLELFLPEEYPMAAPKVCFLAVFNYFIIKCIVIPFFRRTFSIDVRTT